MSDIPKRCFNCEHGGICFIRLAFHKFAETLYDSDLIGYDTDGVLFETRWVKDLADEHLPLHCERYLLVDRSKRNV